MMFFVDVPHLCVIGQEKEGGGPNKGVWGGRRGLIDFCEFFSLEKVRVQLIVFL